MRPSDVFTLASHALDVVAIDGKNSQHLNLFTKAYSDVYLPAFPIPEERESCEKLLKLSLGSDEMRDVSIFVTGRDLSNPDPEQAKINGVFVTTFYPHINAGLLAYIAIDPSEQGNGLGRLLVGFTKAHLQSMANTYGQDLKNFFVEVKDPNRVTVEMDPFGPEKRLSIYYSMGARLIPFDFIGPGLTEECIPYECDNLMYFPLENNPSPTYQDVYDYLQAIYNSDENEPGYNEVMDNFIEFARENAQLNDDTPMSRDVLSVMSEKYLNKHKPLPIVPVPEPLLAARVA